MRLTKLFSILISLQLITSCSTSNEVIMPYKNWGYSGERLFPVKTNNSKFSLRVWVSNSTSVDRIISISKETFDDYKGYLVEYGNFYHKSFKKSLFKQSSITPKDGFSNFIQKIDSLKLLQLSSKQSIGVVEHQPISLYIAATKVFIQAGLTRRHQAAGNRNTTNKRHR